MIDYILSALAAIPITAGREVYSNHEPSWNCRMTHYNEKEREREEREEPWLYIISARTRTSSKLGGLQVDVYTATCE